MAEKRVYDKNFSNESRSLKSTSFPRKKIILVKHRSGGAINAKIAGGGGGLGKIFDITSIQLSLREKL